MTQTCATDLGPSTGTGTKALGYASDCLKELADFPLRGEPVKSAIARAANLVFIGKNKLLYSRAFDIWYRKAKMFRDYEADAILAAVERKRERDTANELADLKTRIAILESRLHSGDADFYSPSISALRQILGVRG
jgi:hypothetical protein